MGGPDGTTVSVRHLVRLRIPLAPVPASRPRVSRWGTYYAKGYKAWMANAAHLINEAKRPLSGPLFVHTELVCERPKTTKRAYPRGDNDNFEKAVWDALTKKRFWEDDDQIVQNFTSKRFALPGEEPHVYVGISPL